MQSLGGGGGGGEAIVWLGPAPTSKMLQVGVENEPNFSKEELEERVVWSPHVSSTAILLHLSHKAIWVFFPFLHGGGMESRAGSLAYLMFHPHDCRAGGGGSPWLWSKDGPKFCLRSFIIQTWPAQNKTSAWFNSEVLSHSQWKLSENGRKLKANFCSRTCSLLLLTLIIISLHAVDKAWWWRRWWACALPKKKSLIRTPESRLQP